MNGQYQAGQNNGLLHVPNRRTISTISGVVYTPAISLLFLLSGLLVSYERVYGDIIMLSGLFLQPQREAKGCGVFLPNPS